MTDSMLPASSVAIVHAPFPAMGPGWLRLARPLLCRLGVLRPGPVRLVLREMSAADGQAYLSLINAVLGGGARIAQALLDGAPQDAFEAQTDAERAIADLRPRLYAIATGIDDDEFFRALPPSQEARLQAAVNAANPTIAAVKKKKSDALLAALRFQTMRMDSPAPS